MIPEIGHFALILALSLALLQGILPMIGAILIINTFPPPEPDREQGPQSRHRRRDQRDGADRHADRRQARVDPAAGQVAPAIDGRVEERLGLVLLLASQHRPEHFARRLGQTVTARAVNHLHDDQHRKRGIQAQRDEAGRHRKRHQRQRDPDAQAPDDTGGEVQFEQDGQEVDDPVHPGQQGAPLAAVFDGVVNQGRLLEIEHRGDEGHDRDEGGDLAGLVLDRRDRHLLEVERSVTAPIPIWRRM